MKEECICSEWDGKGRSVCGFPCPVHKPRKQLLKNIKSRWTQYQWENENQIDWKSVFIGAGFLLVVIGLVVFAL